MVPLGLYPYGVNESDIAVTCKKTKCSVGIGKIPSFNIHGFYLDRLWVRIFI